MVTREKDQDHYLWCNWNTNIFLNPYNHENRILHSFYCLLGAFTKHQGLCSVHGGSTYSFIPFFLPAFSLQFFPLCLIFLCFLTGIPRCEGHDCNHDLNDFCSHRFFCSCAVTPPPGAAWTCIPAGHVMKLSHRKLQFRELIGKPHNPSPQNPSKELFLIMIFSLLFHINTWSRDFWKSSPF